MQTGYILCHCMVRLDLDRFLPVRLNLHGFSPVRLELISVLPDPLYLNRISPLFLFKLSKGVDSLNKKPSMLTTLLNE